MPDLPVYPSERFDTLSEVDELIDPFYTEVYDGGEQVVDYLRATVVTERQVDAMSDAWLSSHSRHDCQISWDFQTYKLTIYAEDVDEDDYPSAAFPLDSEITRFSFAADSPVSPSVILAYDLGVLISEGGNLLFDLNPFADSRWTVDTDDQGVESIDVYLTGVGTNRLTPFESIWSPSSGIAGATTERLKRVANAIIDAYINGTSAATLGEIIEAATGCVTADETETVISVSVNPPGGTVIETANHVYVLPSGATATVSAGDTVSEGQFLSDAVTLYEPRRGRIPSGLTSLTVPAGAMPGVDGPLTFTDTDAALTVTTGVSGYTKLSWPLGGDSGDAADFFTELHSRGVAATATLANYLDNRTNPVGQPTASDLPTTVNPLRMLLENTLRNGVTILQLNSDAFAEGAMSVADITTVVRLVSDPHRLLIIEEV